MYKIKLAALAILLNCPALLMSVSASESDLQVQLNAQQRTMLQLQNEIAQLRAEVAVLRGEVETLRFDLKQSGTTASAAPAARAAPAPAPAVTTAPAPAPAPAPAVTTAPAPAPAAASTAAPPPLRPVDAAAQAAYDEAYARVTANDFPGAARAFNAYLNTYPDNTLTPNAWYWLGQVQYRQNQLDDARVSFLNVARFTQSTKRPDALYKLGLISRSKGEEDKAVRYFNLVISTYPADTSANMARAELAKYR